MKGALVLFGALLLCNCASVRVRREIHDEKGGLVGWTVVNHSNATSDGAAAILAQVREFDESQRHEVENLARASIEKGQPTVLRTQRGDVTSGYVGGYSMTPYGTQAGYGSQHGAFGSLYEQYGINPATLPAGVSPAVLLAERLQQSGRSFRLQPLPETAVIQQGVAPLPSPASGTQCPPRPARPTTSEQRMSCIENDLDSVIRSLKGK